MSYEANDDVFPAKAVMYIEARWGSAWYVGSGAIVGRNDVLTAAHVVYNINLGGLADEIRAYPSYDPDEPNTAFYKPVLINYFPNFDPDGDGRLIAGDFNRPTYEGTEIDIALLTFSSPLGDAYGWFGMDPNFTKGSVGVLGHPGKYGYNMMFDSGSVEKHSVDAYLKYGADLEINPGNSGGPVYYDYGDGPFIVGVVSTGYAATAVGGHWHWLPGKISSNDSYIETTFAQLFASNPHIAGGISAAYEVLLGGVPTEAGFTYLINTALSTNFGAGPGPIFNAENIFINLANNLVQGNSTAHAIFDQLATGNTLAENITSIYQAIIPPSYQTANGLAYLLRPQGLAFYQQVAFERGVAGTDGGAIVAMASLLKITVDQDIGIGNAVNDLRNAVAMGSDRLLASGTNLIDIEVADGTQFDGDDAMASSASAEMLAIVGTASDQMPLLV